MKSKSIRRLVLRQAAAAALTLAVLPSWAQDAASRYPEKAVTIVVGYTAGGPTDSIARMLAEELSKRFGQSFVIDNRPGANGAVAAALVKKAAPDGYTLMLATSGTLAIAPLLQSLPYDPLKDFTTVGLVASFPYFLLVPASSPIKTYDELVQKGRNSTSAMSFASAGSGADNHLAGEWLGYEAGIKVTHVPYKGDSAAIPDLIAGRVDLAFLSGAAALPHVRGGKLRILASASAVPGRGGKELLTIGESRIKGFAAEPWNGIVGPAGLPPGIVARLNTAINEIMRRKDIEEKLASMEQYALTGSPGQFTTHIQNEKVRWGTVVKTANVKID